MTLPEIEDRVALMKAAGRRNVPVPVDEWSEIMAARIGKATVKNGKLTRVVKGSSIQKAASARKKARKVAGLQANRASVKAKGKA